MADDIVTEIEEMLDNTEAPMTRECCICRVPRQIRKLNEDAYTPKVVSIGPFHYKSPDLENMESQKKIFLKRFLERNRINLKSLVSCVEHLELKVRSCYLHDIGYYEKEFVKMILLDAVFILELFSQFYCRDRTEDDDLPLKNWLMNDIIRDLYLLENQLPFFVLDELYNQAYPTPPRGNHPSFLTLTFSVFNHHNKQRLVPGTVTMCHFTDLLRKLYLQPSERRPHRQDAMISNLCTVSSVTELHGMGVKFMTDTTSRCLLDLQFSVSGCLLKIPQLTVDDETEMLFRNIIALEQCHYPREQYITGYVFLLSCLIKTDEDADILIKNGIIVNHLDRTNNATRLFRSLGKNTPVRGSSSAHNLLCRQLNGLCKDRKTRMMTTLRRDYYLDLKSTYCKTPLETLATLGGILLLILAVIQTVCSIVQVL